VNPISKATSVIFHPVQTVSAVAGQTYGVAAAGVRTTMRILDRAAGHGRGDNATDWSPDGTTATSAPESQSADEVPTATPPARKAPASKAAARKAPANKAPAKKATRKTAARKAPSARAATVAPALSEPERAVIDEPEVLTPSGIPAADEAHNPDTTDTDLHQPGTEPLMDPATVKAIKSEAEIMQRAADPDKG
jgi:hypothetical protein